MRLSVLKLFALLALSSTALVRKDRVADERKFPIALRRACAEGQKEVLLDLLEIGGKLESSLEATFLLHETVKKGYLDMTKILIENYAFELNRVHMILKECFVPLCEAGNVEFINFVISEYPDAVSSDLFDEAIMQSIENGNVELIKVLTDFKRISLKAAFHILRSAAKLGSVDIYKLVGGDLMNSPNVHTRASFIIACTCGHEELMNWLIETGVDPSMSRNEGLLATVCNGHLTVFKRLLTFKSVMDHFDALKMCRKALTADQPDVLEFLLKQFHIEPLHLDEFLLKSCKKKRVLCLSMMLRATYVTPTRAVLNAAIEASNYKAVKALLKDGRIDPTVNKEQILRDACYFKDLKLLSLLIKDGRVDPSTDNCYALNLLVAHGLENTDKCLRAIVRDPRIQHRIDDAVRTAVARRNFDASLILYAHPIAMIHPVCSDPMNDLLETCKKGILLDVIGDFLSIPLHFLEFIVRCSLTHGHVCAFKFGFEEMLEEFSLGLEETSDNNAKRILYNMTETIDYCIFWILTNDLGDLLQYLGQTMRPYKFLSVTKKFSAVSALHYIFEVHEILVEIFGERNLQDVAGIIMQYNLKEFIATYRI